MKIAFIGCRNIHKLGGIETYMYNLCTNLVLFGHEPIVYCESDSNQEEFLNGFKVIHWKSPKSVYFCKICLGLKSTLDALFRQKDVLLFHYNAWPPSIWSWIPRLFGRSSLMMGHGLEWKRTKYSKKQQKLMKLMELITANMNKNLVMCSQEQTDYFLKEYNKKCTTITSAVNLPDPEDIPDTCLMKFNLKPRKYFLYLGRLVQDKNPDYLIKAFIDSKIDDLKLVIAGANDSNLEYVNYLHLISEENENIIFTGAVYDMDKECLLKNCLVFCIPSTVEGLSITLLEAMSYGKPVIASDILANKEGLGNNGLWVKTEDINSLRDQLIFCQDNVEIIIKSGKTNRQRIKEKFTWDVITKRYCDYISNIH